MYTKAALHHESNHTVTLTFPQCTQRSWSLTHLSVSGPLGGGLVACWHPEALLKFCHQRIGPIWKINQCADICFFLSLLLLSTSGCHAVSTTQRWQLLWHSESEGRQRGQQRPHRRGQMLWKRHGLTHRHKDLWGLHNKVGGVTWSSGSLWPMEEFLFITSVWQSPQ